MLTKFSVPAAVAASLLVAAPAFAQEAPAPAHGSGPVILADAQLDAISAAGTLSVFATVDGETIFDADITDGDLPTANVTAILNASGNGDVFLNGVKVARVNLDLDALGL